MEYNEDDFLPLGGIQHFALCPRQWALIYIERQWKENLRTIEGDIFHENAHNGDFREMRGNTITTRGLPVFSRTLGINGICDVVEFKKDAKGVPLKFAEGKWIPVPVEYKKGKPKENDCDILQAAAQAICLEEMLLCTIEKCYLYYGETKHRTEVILNSEIRERVSGITKQMHSYYERRRTPKVKIGKRCNACSLKEICMPMLCKDISARNYIDSRLSEMGEPR